MAGLDDVVKVAFTGTGVVVGLGAVVLAPTLLPVLGRVLRPIAKEALKLGVSAYDGVSEAVAGVGDAASDLIAEVRAEAAGAARATADAIAPAPAPASRRKTS